MSAPSVVHESRRDDLATVFQLAGLTAPAHLQWWLQPDVAMAAPHAHVLGIGDAKATERPGTASTLRRLIAYARAARRWHRAGWEVSMALAVSPKDEREWLVELARAWVRADLVARHESALKIDPDLSVVWISTSRGRSSTNVGGSRSLGV